MEGFVEKRDDGYWVAGPASRWTRSSVSSSRADPHGAENRSLISKPYRLPASQNPIEISVKQANALVVKIATGIASPAITGLGIVTFT